MQKVVTIIFLLSFYNAFTQGSVDGFYNGKGNITTVLGFGLEDTGSYFAGTNKIDLSRDLYYINLYGSFGITNNLDTQIALPFIVIDENKNLQDIQVFFKYRFLSIDSNKGKFQLSAAMGFSTPLSNYSIGGLNDIGQQATRLAGKIVSHYKFNEGWFFTLQSGYTVNLDEVPDTIPLSFKAGKATSGWYYDAFYEYQYAIGGIDYLGTPRPQNFREFGVDFHKVGGTLHKSITENFGAYTSFSYVLSGRNVFQGPGYGVGLSYTFRKSKKAAE